LRTSCPNICSCQLSADGAASAKVADDALAGAVGVEGNGAAIVELGDGATRQRCRGVMGEGVDNERRVGFVAAGDADKMRTFSAHRTKSARRQ